jgi:hypothetical protein
MMFASVTPTLVSIGLFPVPVSADYTQSIASIKEAVYSIRYEAWVGKDFVPHRAHTGCNLGLKDSITTILNGMPSPVDDVHLAHLVRQAEITGIDNGSSLRGFSTRNSAEIEELKLNDSPPSEKSFMVIKVEHDGRRNIINTKKENDLQNFGDRDNGSMSNKSRNRGRITIAVKKENDLQDFHDRGNGSVPSNSSGEDEINNAEDDIQPKSEVSEGK